MRFDKNVDEEVRRACLEFGKWLRQEYYFPIRVPIYVKSAYKLKTRDGGLVIGTFFEPFDRSKEPYARIATGDYYDLIAKWGKNDAIYSILHTIAHELSHYFQWINDVKLTPIGEERQATNYAYYVMYDYKEFREHM